MKRVGAPVTARRQVGRLLGHRAVVRREGAVERPLARAGGRERGSRGRSRSQGGGERRDVVARQPAHRLLRQARGRRAEPDLHPRPRAAARRSASRTSPPARARRSSARRQGDPLHQRRLSRRARRRGEQEDREGAQGPEVQRPHLRRRSRSGSGTAGSTTSRCTSSVQRSTAASKANDLLAGTKLVAGAGLRRTDRARARATRSTRVWSPDGQSIVFAVRRRTATPPRTPRCRSTSIASPAGGGEPQLIAHDDGELRASALQSRRQDALRDLQRRTTGRSTTSIGSSRSTGRRCRTAARRSPRAVDRSVGGYAISPDGEDDLLHRRGCGAGEDLHACARAAATATQLARSAGARRLHRRADVAENAPVLIGALGQLDQSGRGRAHRPRRRSRTRT